MKFSLVFVILFWVFHSQASSIDTATTPKDTSTPHSPNLIYNPNRMQLIVPAIEKRELPTRISLGLFIIGSILDYSLIKPKQRTIDDIGDQFALINPIILVTGIKIVTIPLACKQAEQASALYKDFMGSAPPHNPSKTLYYMGWAFYGISVVISYKDFPAVDAVNQQYASYIAMGADAFWLWANLSALYYLSHTKKQAKEILSQSKITLSPTKNFIDNPGLQLSILF